VFPGLLDCHTHLDKTHTWHRAPNPTGEFWDAITALGADSARWTEEDIYRRASFALECAYAHGTVALRTHVDTWGTRESPAFAALARLRAEWAGRITLQTVTLCNLQAFADGEAAGILEFTARNGATALGGFPQPNPDLPRQLDALLAAARELGVGVDLHVDESGLVHAECLRATAEAVLRNQFPHPVACGHNCSLAVQDPARAASTLDLVKEAGIGLISLPLCNLYLQGRDRAPAAPGAPSGARGAPRTPRWRGLMLAHEALDRGIPVACASDNVRDAFFAWGDYDALEVFSESVRIGHLDTRLAAAPSVVTTGPAAIMGLPDHGRVAPGARSALVVTAATTFNELLARPAAPRRLVRQGRLVTPQAPSYAALLPG
jgi:cytosine deaminase